MAEKINGNMDTMKMITIMSEGNPGAITMKTLIRLIPDGTNGTRLKKSHSNVVLHKCIVQ